MLRAVLSSRVCVCVVEMVAAVCFGVRQGRSVCLPALWWGSGGSVWCCCFAFLFSPSTWTSRSPHFHPRCTPGSPPDTSSASEETRSFTKVSSAHVASTENEHHAAHLLFCKHFVSLNPSETCFLLHCLCVVYVIMNFDVFSCTEEGTENCFSLLTVV